MSSPRELRPWFLLLVLTAAMQSPAAADFIRGDANRDGKVQISDGVTQAIALFRPEVRLPCLDAADSNDDGRVDLSDAVITLTYLFIQGELPYPGAASPGPDPTCDALDCADTAPSPPAIVLSEISYNPGSQLAEFVELHNRSGVAIDVSGYSFTRGITFTIPGGTSIPPRGFLLVLRDPTLTAWKSLPVTRVGPYAGELADGGERLELQGGGCNFEAFKYDDRPPWPTGADGGGSSLERVNYLEPADDFHSWRASLTAGGTPGIENSTAGTPARPVMIFWSVKPEAPRSTDDVELTVSLDAPRAAIQKAILRWERVAAAIGEPSSTELEPFEQGPDWTAFRATLPPAPSQSLVRSSVEVELASGELLQLPHPGEPAPVLSYFVYDGEVAAKLPILWILRPRRSGVIPGSRQLGGVVIREVTGPQPLVFDGARLRGSRNGLKLEFLKGAEYRDDRTLNILPEEGLPIATMTMAPHLEHLSMQIFRDIGALAPRVDWFRVLDPGAAAKQHTQRLVIQQVNERFLELNGLDPDGDLYKLDHRSFAKQTNVETGNHSITDLLAELQSEGARRRQAVLDRLDLENVCLYSVGSVFTDNADGYTNNLFVYNDLSPGGRWRVVPWDLDLVFGSPESPIAAPLGGTISGPYHLEPDLDERYRRTLAAVTAPEGPLGVAPLLAKLQAIEDLLLEDLRLQEAYMGVERTARRTQIVDAYAAMRTYIERRVAFLQAALR